MTRRRVLKAIGWGALAGFGVVVGEWISDNQQAEEFITHSMTIMRQSGDPMRVSDAYTRKFADGSAIAIIMEHACCTGAGFNATVIYDSRGRIAINRTRCFCGYEEMDSVMDSVPATSLDQFYANLHDLPLTNR